MSDETVASSSDNPEIQLWARWAKAERAGRENAEQLVATLLAKIAGDEQPKPAKSAEKPAAPVEAEPVARSASESVLLFGQKEKPIVKGTEKDTLTTAQYNVVMALIKAGEKGLTKDELDRKSGHGDARKILKRLTKNDSDWEEVIPFPGTTGMGYRIL